MKHSDVDSVEPGVNLLQRPNLHSKTKNLSGPELRQFNLRQSFHEELNKHFPSHVHQAILELGVSTIKDAYYMAIEDLIESPKITRVQARKVHSLLQHHMVHHSYPETIMPQIPYRPNASKVPLR